MQSLKSLFVRRQVQSTAVAPVGQPVELSAESLKLVGGGLPRVGLVADPVVDSEAAVAGVDELPRVG